MSRHLHLQVSIYIVVSALLLSLLAAWQIYSQSYDNEVKRVNLWSKELIETVSSSASLACYINEKEMLNEVVQGLLHNSVVATAKLRTSQGTEITAGKNLAINSDFTLKRDLITPFKEAGDGKVGELIIIQDRKQIEQRAGELARINALSVLLIVLLISLCTMTFVYRLATRPLKETASLLHRLTVGEPERLPIPLLHQNNELGLLISDINRLLDKAGLALDSERTLRMKFEFFEARYRTIFEQATSSIFLTNSRGDLDIYNASFAKLVQESGRDIKRLTNIVPLFLDQVKVKKMIDMAIRWKNPIAFDLQVATIKDQKEIWIHAVFSANAHNIIEGIFYNITQRRKQESKVRDKAERDHLTGLNNRLMLEKLLDKTLWLQPDKAPNSVTMFMLDLDGFKFINDTWGHAAGDLVLQEIANRLNTICRNSDIVARWGGDEFVIVFSNTIDKTNCFSIAEKLWKYLSIPIDIEQDEDGKVGASIGVCTLGQDIFNKDLLIQKADEAMYNVKEAGKNGVCFYDAYSDSFETLLFKKTSCPTKRTTQ